MSLPGWLVHPEHTDLIFLPSSVKRIPHLSSGVPCCGVQAVLIEHDQLALSELSAVVVSGGRRGDNLIKDYDQVCLQNCMSLHGPAFAFVTVFLFSWERDVVPHSISFSGHTNVHG